jgi:dethiobiotin synthetase
VNGRGFFVTGTDTGVGKTRIAAALLHGFSLAGLSTAGMKPVAAGCDWRDGAAYWEDVEQLVDASSVRADLALVNPYRFEAPIAPHLAAAQAGVSIQMDVIVAACGALQAQAEVVVVEGAGGWLVPLSAQHSMADLAIQLGLPVILVVGMRLGCISHALLTMAAIAQSGVPVAGWIANQTAPDMLAIDGNLAALRARIAAPLLGVAPWQPAPDLSGLAACLDLDAALSD